MHKEENTEGVSLEAVLQRDNMLEAWRTVKSNRGAAGIDGMDIDRTETHLKAHWSAIAEKLRVGCYRPAAVRAVTIPKPGGGSRTLGIPNVQDRLIQQAIHQKLSPLWEAEFSVHSYGYRPGRSAHDAVKAAQGYVAAGKVWVVDIDLKSFFDEINHDRLMRLVGEKIRDKTLMKLIGRILRAPIVRPDGSRMKRGKGTPQGGPLSPLLANIYLDELDKELENRGLSFVRYADDIAIYVSSERSAARIMDSLSAWIEKHLKVPVNRDKSGSGHTDGGSLLGFRIRSDGDIGISPQAINKLKDKVRELWNAQQNRTSSELRDRWLRYITGWWNYYQLATRRWEVINLTGWIRRHMRKCFWLRWKTPKGRLNKLKRLGVNHRAQGIAYTGLGAWAVAKSWAMNTALSNKTLRKYGLVIPWDFAKVKA